LNDTVTAGNCARWLITSGALVILMSAMPLKGTWPVLPVWVGRYKVPSDLQIGQAVGLGHQHHAVLVGLVENGRDDALAERIVERVVDGRRSDAVARGQLPVDLDVDAQAIVVQVAGDVGDRGDLFSSARSVRARIVGTPAGSARAARTGTGSATPWCRA
jgi:hypothetical protein